MIDQEKFFAWLDGELSPNEAAAIETQVAADPELSRMAAEHRKMANALRTAFDNVAEADVPERLSASVHGRASNVQDLASWRQRFTQRSNGAIPQWAAMAAALALGIAVGTTLNSERASSPVEVRGGAIYAAGEVGRALERQLASAGASGDVRVLLTFRNDSGSVCRTFDTQSSSGLACRESGQWRLRGLFAAPEGERSEYRMAAGPDPRLMELVDSTIAGEPFDAAQEKAARDSNWR
jgi:hypothetical protein